MDRHIIRTRDLDWSSLPSGRHPFNPDSEMKMARLGDQTGMKRVLTNLVRLPPGKESFIAHSHAVEEEFIFVLEGTGEVTLDGEAHAVGPGDFVGFPTDGVVHGFRNTGASDLLYLTAGERARVEIAEMPSIGKTTVFRPGRITMFGDGGVEELTPEEWGARTKLP
ncbi:cupin domain-containing protein [Phenylobacterium sp. 20VBR1]|uniref:Cupin domain-containing protein n=1 Tax=Phenylobacterium glaciei TaxID=2803784 RepID=A0A941HUV7_9CAUL|nr:cupin domain-containing protein [Phenylobacterium glaciei]MBR7618018.1 cupin domain-containing protein [Phenylobacterium glaciei]